MNKNQRLRNLHYRKQILKQEAAMYQKQRKLLPVIIVCGIFAFLSWVAPIFLSGNNLLLTTKFVDNKSGFKINQSQAIAFSDVTSFPKNISAGDTEYFIYKEDKILYHFFCENEKLTSAITNRFTYHFREPGKYAIVKRPHYLIPKDLELTSKLTGYEAPKNISILTFSKWLFLIATLVLLLLQDYFGNAKNYPLIWKRKHMILKTKEFGVVLALGIVLFSWGFYVLSSDYGHAGFANDNHAPYSSLKEMDTYYVN